MSDFEVVDVGEFNRLKQKLADAERQNEWISVEDRLPIDHEYKLLCTNLNSYVAAWYSLKQEKFIGYSGYINNDRITHWKPITPPQTEIKSLGETKHWGDKI